MKILLTGKSGQVGWELQRTLYTLGDVIAPGSAELNLADPDAIVSCVRAIKPDLIVNPAAYTAVDKAESEVELAMAVNGRAPGILAEEAKLLGIPLIHYSTDYVFDGRKANAYVEEDATNPLGTYGRSKLAGEQAIAAVGGDFLILRTSWVYGVRGKNFFLTMARLLRERPEVRVVADQWGAPTWSRLIAEATAHIVARSTPEWRASGIFHLTAAGATSWHGFATGIAQALAGSGAVLPIPSSDYPTPAQRPANSRLATDKLRSTFGINLPDWSACLAMVVADLEAR
jgi:dTDP-4-dehydrorhamnose reductase